MRRELRIDANAEQQGDEADAETRARNQRMAAQRNGDGLQNRQQREAERERMRRIVHENLVDRYKKLIPLLKFKKNDKAIDEFNTAECVICMETFVNGTKVRKIPSCKHIFHDECLIKWLSGSQQQEAQKCPMCNSDITPAILEKAIFEESSPKKQAVLDLRGSPSRPRVQINGSAPYAQSTSALGGRSPARGGGGGAPDIIELVSQNDIDRTDSSMTYLQAPIQGQSQLDSNRG